MSFLSRYLLVRQLRGANLIHFVCPCSWCNGFRTGARTSRKVVLGHVRGEQAADPCERGVDVHSESLHGDHSTEANQGDDQRIFHQTLPGFVFVKAAQRLHNQVLHLLSPNVCYFRHPGVAPVTTVGTTRSRLGTKRLARRKSLDALQMLEAVSAR